MSYNFTPLSDEELEAINLISPGVYDFEVVKSTRKVSKQGNQMAELQLNVLDSHGRHHTIFDYLVFSDVNLNIKKVSHFCKSVGLEEDYKKGCLPETLERCSGSLDIGIQEEQPKPMGGYYPKKNIVVDYIKPNGEKKVSPQVDTAFNDDLPF